MVSYCLDRRQVDELQLLLMVRFCYEIQVQHQQNVCDSSLSSHCHLLECVCSMVIRYRLFILMRSAEDLHWQRWKAFERRNMFIISSKDLSSFSL
jgi:hypothetical protein